MSPRRRVDEAKGATASMTSESETILKSCYAAPFEATVTQDLQRGDDAAYQWIWQHTGRQEKGRKRRTEGSSRAIRSQSGFWRTLYGPAAVQPEMLPRISRVSAAPTLL